ncbi:hypothetical protein O6H91_08G115500 [Diphasiastrum complanatum]|uniref:Uncharacterized protein n=1 Tax=Diphasiastrum complanatum TaxID=34168 RepID=A0ACC2D191_DIPCM|nr:hypothetical protein O6H91_08G115500 [Diphasiastrum complanatum]
MLQRSSSVRRLSFPLSTLEYGWRTAFACSRFIRAHLCRNHARIRGLASRVQTTIRGSGEDIGWLLRTSDALPIEDGTDRFLQILQRINEGVHTLPNNLVYLLVPGLFSNYGPLYMVNMKKYFSKLGLNCSIAQIHSEASVAKNAAEIKQYIEELYWGPNKQVMLIGHSKGGVDAAAALALFWPDLKDKVAGIVLVQCPYGGSPIAADILREGQLADNETRQFMEMFIRRILKGDIKALDDLTYKKRREFLAKYPLPEAFPIVTFHTEVGINPGVFSTLHQVAHAELPWLSIIPASNHELDNDCVAGTKLPVVAPLAATAVVLAIHLALRYGEKSDGLVTRKDAEVPGTVAVRLHRKLDHLWMVYSHDPAAPQMCEALITLLLEKTPSYFSCPIPHKNLKDEKLGATTYMPKSK